MRCTTARKTYLFENRVVDHVATCGACRTWVADQESLTLVLGELRREIPFDVDVTARVAAGVAAMDAPTRDVPSRRLLGWAAGAGLAAAILLAGILWAQSPDLAQIAAGARALFAALGEAASSLTTPLATLVPTVMRPVGRLIVAAGTVARSASEFRWLAVAMITLCSAMMATTIFLVVSRDVRRHTWTSKD